MAEEEQFFGNLGETLFVQEDADHDGYPVLKFTADTRGSYTTVMLTPYSVKGLRLYLHKWEKRVAAKQDHAMSGKLKKDG